MLLSGISLSARLPEIRLFTVEDGLSQSEITTCFIDSYGLLWVGTTNGLNIFNGYEFRTYHHQPLVEYSLSNSHILSIAEDSSSNIWISTNNGINIFNRQNGKFSRFIHKSDDPGTIGGKEVYAVYAQQNGEVWLKTERYFERLNPENGRSVKYKHFHNTDSVSPSGYSTSIAQDVNGDFWFNSQNSLFSFSPENELVTHYENIADDQHSLAGYEINKIFLDKSGELWIVTLSGLHRFDRQKNRFIKYPILNASPSLFYSINEDTEGNLWLGTDNGLYCLNMKSSEITGIEKFSLYNSAFSPGPITAIAIDKYGIVWLGTKKGLIKLDERHFKNALLANNEIGQSGDLTMKNNIPEIILWDMVILGSGEEKHVYIGGHDASATIKYDQTINITFAALDYTYPGKNKFIYSLGPVGRKENWVNIGTQNKITFSSLNSGEYIFRVRGSDNEGNWNMDSKSLILFVEAPFWKTTIANYSYFLFGTLLIYSFIQARTLSLRRSNRILRDRDLVAREVQKQKELLSLRNKNIEDSLKYAQRIQLALFTNQKAFKAILPQSFIFHEPKDIVSGDFYWIFELNGKIFLAAVDCTGHGVPGAFVSLIGFELFRKIIITQKVHNPARILYSLNKNFEEIFGSIEGEFILKDGMDLAFCVIDKKTNLLEFAGAFNPVYIIRDDKLIELKGDRFSIGADSIQEEDNTKNFTTHNFQLEANDMLYMFSDGYPDQFGGPEGKKFKYRRFRHLLLNLHDLPLDKQKQYLKDRMEEWKGNYEQVDDILVIGIRV